jgi:4-amino-4-deoxy-L-arabinose transferase-like glycosyltransferase
MPDETPEAHTALAAEGDGPSERADENATETYEAAPATRKRARPPVLVWVITGLFISLMTMCTFLYPSFSGYDEVWHVDMTYSYYNGHGFYAPAGRKLSIGVQRANDIVGTVPPPTPFTQHPAYPSRGQRSSFDALGGDRAGTFPIPNQMVQHPPLYYVIGAGLMHLIPGSHHLSFDRWVAILRYMSILMVAPVPILAWATVRALVGDGPAAVAAAALPLTLPNLARIGGSVNNDNLLTLLTAVVLLFCARIIAGDLRKRTGLLVGLALGLDCLTKGYALVLPVVVLMAYAVAWVRHRRNPWAPVVGAAVVTAAVGGWWWIRNIVLFHTVQPDGIGAAGKKLFFNKPRPGFTTSQFIPKFFWRMMIRTWGGIGLPEHPLLSPTLCWVWTGFIAAAALLGVGFGLRGRLGRWGALTFVLPTLLILALPAEASHHQYLISGDLPGDQGRYLYPSVTAVGVLVGVGYTRLMGRKFAGWLPLAVIVGALITQLIAWRDLIHVWWVPTTAGADRTTEIRQAFRGILHFSPWPNPATTAPFVVVGLMTIALLVAAGAYGWMNRRGAELPLVTEGPRP